MRSWILPLALCLVPLSAAAQPAEDEQAVRALMVDTYVEGLHVQRNLDAVRRGFHPDFVMHVYDDGQLIPATLDMWLERLQLDGTRNPKRVGHRFDWIDVTGNSAAVKMQIFEDDQHIYTDYFGLYRFEEGWRIVNKIFFGHD